MCMYVMYVYVVGDVCMCDWYVCDVCNACVYVVCVCVCMCA